MNLPAGSVTFIAATALEYQALRKALPQARIVRSGIALANLRGDLGEIVVSCGVAGGLKRGLPTGTVLIPRSVRRPDGTIMQCDDDLVDLFAKSARRLAFEPVFDPMLTSATLICGNERTHWASLGYAGVDMETGRILAPRVAAVRIVLDTPEREISCDWAQPLRAILKPWNWPQAVWLSREAPRAAASAARVVAGAQGIAAGVRITGQ